MSQRKLSEKDPSKRKSSLPMDFNNLNFDILNPAHLSKIQGPDYDFLSNLDEKYRLFHWVFRKTYK